MTLSSRYCSRSLDILPYSATVANLSRFSLPVYWGQLTQTPTSALACLFTYFTNKEANISQTFFQSIVFSLGAQLSYEQMETIIHTLIGLQDAETPQKALHLVPPWIHSLNELAGGYLSRCLCADGFADVSICPFYFWSLQEFIIDTMNLDLWCLEPCKESWETAIGCTFLFIFLRLSLIYLCIVPNASHPTFFFSSGVFILCTDFFNGNKGINHLYMINCIQILQSVFCFYFVMSFIMYKFSFKFYIVKISVFFCIKFYTYEVLFYPQNNFLNLIWLLNNFIVLSLKL